MSLDENTSIVQQFGQIWGQGSLDLINKFASPDIEVSYPLLPETVHGPEAFKEVILGVRSALPDVECEVHETIAQDDRVAARWTMRGTQTGEWNGIPPTGKVVTLRGITIYRIIDGKVVEENGQEDALGLLHQLGVIPTPEKAST
jgi:steroid delta-isomerase-like uncharacterized protein